jgi:hypothetical protein
MATRRRLRKEDQEELKRRKKELRKSYEKTRPDSKKVGSKRISDTQKYLLVGSAAIIIIVIISIQFLIPPVPICYYTESDFVYATLDQDSQKVSFNRIIAHYLIRPDHTEVNGNIYDYFNSSYKIAPPDQPAHSSPPYVNSITYTLANVKVPLIWACRMENGTALQMSTWINKTVMTLTPSSIPKNVLRNVNFRLAITTQISVDRYNISLKFNKNLPNTSINFVSIKNGTSFFNQNGTIFTQGVNLAARSTILLDFNLSIITAPSFSELNFLEYGNFYLVKKGELLQSYAGASAFRESEIFFTGFGLSDEPTLKKTKFLDIVGIIPYFNITLT